MKARVYAVYDGDDCLFVGNTCEVARYLERSVNSLYSSISHYKKKHDGKTGEMPIVFHGRKTLARIEE
ncbi:hypothetical protein EDX97_07870 [Absicoccus porci]|uniref:Uncharacterized protein n=1 Tax=Absicoccus porci TaxID=2486576 RepID=A0A3N0I197_9FIRM|nr:hypothetical protein [Absicoccus porci]RNM30688.1 hypothetical protein EDX97_07870 [Absicoccus porci]